MSPDAPPMSETSSAEILGSWVSSLAKDALVVAEVSQEFPPGAPLRAPLRAGLRHLLHIVKLSQGIEALAMLEVTLMLRVTALLAAPAEELDSETVIRLRADTPLIEELFPEEKAVIWQFCEALIEAERALPSEQTPSLTAAREVIEQGTIESLAEVSEADAVDGVLPSLEQAAEPEGVPSLGQPTSSEQSFGDAEAPTAATAEAAPTDELVERVRRWAATYRVPEFGTKPYDLTRARAFVRTRVNAWSGF